MKSTKTHKKQMDEEQGEQEATQEAETPARVTRQKGKDVVVSFRLDEAVVERFNDYAFINRVSKKEALRTIISEYLDGRGLDEADRLVLERFERKEYKGHLPQHDTHERAAYEFFRANPRRKAVLVMDTEAAMRFLFDAAHGNEF
nr:MAG TPA: antitoxin [Caudoviricetes sp.]